MNEKYFVTVSQFSKNWDRKEDSVKYMNFQEFIAI